MVIDEADLEMTTNQFINDIRKFNNEHIIQCYNETKYNIPEEPRYISSMTQNIFINGQYESICCVNLSFQVILFDIYFQTVNHEY